VITLLIVGAVICALIGWVWLMVAGFAASVPWGVGILFFGPLGLVFGFFNWPEYKVPMFLYAGGLIVWGVTSIL
jgi:hypothetical protein